MPRVAVGNKFLERVQKPSEPSSPRRGGEVLWTEKHSPEEPAVYYRHPGGGELWIGDSLKWLAGLAEGSVDLIFADPPYNIGKAEWDDFGSHDAYIEWSVQWIAMASRALKPSGSLYVCGFPEVLADIRRPGAGFFSGCRWLTWFYKNKANLTRDWGRSHEAIIHYRKSKKTRINVDDVRIPYGRHTLKYPSHPQATSSQYGRGHKRKDAWTPHPRGAKPRDVIEVPVTSNGMVEKTPHPTQKPEELVRRFILASSNQGDVVVDPFSGSGTTPVCAEQLGRRWLACDINPEYCHWATLRLQNIESRTVEEWIEFDRVTAERREAIR
ncbi:MAG: site-specific DNA-methyltransferase [Proteobacteria bacterium]|nr:site-specific DNA-methyltransferase [Pseudomonadota bacterium]